MQWRNNGYKSFRSGQESWGVGVKLWECTGKGKVFKTVKQKRSKQTNKQTNKQINKKQNKTKRLNPIYCFCK
jgi:hypothetical protein